MILFFSGTGNSRYVEEQLAALTNDTTLSIFEGDIDREAASWEIVGLVFPVHAWGMPIVYRRFIERLVQHTDFHPKYIYMVCTCGDDIGRTDREVRKILKKGGHTLDAACSILMPNTYIALPGFDVDAPETVREKIQNALPRIKRIADIIHRRERGFCDVYPGDFPAFKSYILRPLFHIFLTGDRRFRVEQNCNRCGRCLRHCPMKNITFGKSGLPTWQGNCADCLACYHACPAQAIRYGRFSAHKGQFPPNCQSKNHAHETKVSRA